jgi:hypothetical protein
MIQIIVKIKGSAPDDPPAPVEEIKASGLVPGEEVTLTVVSPKLVEEWKIVRYGDAHEVRLASVRND